jgi:hypothetical protein
LAAFSAVEPEPVLYRTEAVALMFAVSDILVQVIAIRAVEHRPA